MTHKRTWIQRHRRVEDCLQVLRSLDSRTLQRRAGRLSIETQIETPVGFYMPNRTALLFDEAGACFTNGQYNGCVFVLATGVEYGLRKLLNSPKSRRLNKLIQDGVDTGNITAGEADVLGELRNYRNQATHSDIARLAVGIRLSRQSVKLTPHGEESTSEWEEFEPQSQSDMETAVHLAAEEKVGELFLKVREAMYEIFDRYSSPNRSRDAQC